MTHTYTLEGMTCNGCVAKVKNELLKHPDILSAEVSLNPQQAVISMSRHVGVAELQKAVDHAGHYTLREDKNDASHAAMKGDTRTWLETYKPILLIFGFITGISLISSSAHEFNAMMFMNYFMAGFFLTFSFFKLLNVEAFANSYAMYDLLAMKVPAYGLIYPFIELALGIAYLTGFNPLVTNLTTVIVMGFSSIGVIISVLNKKKIQCACLGAVFDLPMSTVTIIEDVLMVAMSAIALITLV